MPVTYINHSQKKGRKTKMKKIVSVLLLLVMLMSVCSFASAEDAPAYDGSEVTIRFY